MSAPLSTDGWLLHAADRIGAHAVPVFVALLVGLLLAATALWWAWGAWLAPHRAGPVRRWLLVGSTAAGFAFTVGAAALFAEIAEQLVPDGRMARLDDALTAALRRHLGIATLRSFALLTHFGDPPTLTLLAIVVSGLLAWRRRWSLVIGWLLAVGGNALLNPLLKRIFERVRPLHEHGLTSDGGYSFPSGHSSGATVAYGMLAYIALRTLPPRWHLPALLAAVAVVFTVGSSRVFLQVHFASDVVAGFASGAAWLAVCIFSIESSRMWRGRRRGTA